MIDDFVRPPRKPLKQSAAKNENPPKDKILEVPSEEPSFVPPEQVAASDDKLDDTIDLDTDNNKPSEPKEHWWNKLAAWYGNLGGKGKAAVILSTLLVIAGASFTGYALFLKKAPAPVAKKVTPAAKVKPVPKSDKVANTLTGRLVAPDVNKIPVTAVMIENSTDARPQSGLYDAGVVFEAIAEGGITRFMALYQDTSPDYVGPVRSARPYYLDWAQGFDAPIAHVGGSPQALQQIKSDGMVDLDQFFNSKAYHRVSNRFAPHNVYTSIAALNQLEAEKNHSSSNFTGFARKADAPSKTPTAKTIAVNISGKLYNSSYTYDPTTNSYLRSEAGAPHNDEKAAKQINPKVVVIIITHYGIQSDGKHSDYTTIGNGQALIFQDGIVTTANWAKQSKKQQIKFTDAAGKPVGLNAGQTWITSVDSSAKVTYQP